MAVLRRPESLLTMPEETAPAQSETTEPAAPVATIAEIGRHEGQSVTLQGWLYNLRESGKLVFPHLSRRDGVDPGRGAREKRFAGSV